MTTRYDNLFQPLSINKMELKNRIIMPAMGTLLADEGHRVSEKHLAYYGARARGGVAMIVTETAEVDDYACGPTSLGIYDDRHIPGLKKLADTVHEGGAKLCAQLHDFGRETVLFGVKPTKAPSKLPCRMCQDIPDVMNEDEILQAIAHFAQSARRAKEAGMDAVELHGAHGYLIAQFMSPFSNRRTDEWGGNLEGRMRFPLEVIKAVRKMAGPDFPIIFRISADEGVWGGRSIEESVLIAPILAASGVDALSVSTGVYDTMNRAVAAMGQPRGLNVEAAEKIKAVVDVPVIVAGRLNSPMLAQSVIQTKKADFVAIGRGILCDPDFPNKIKEGRIDDIRWCISCNQGCIDKIVSTGTPVTCLMNPEAGRETEMKMEPANPKKKILVAGGGPAGMEAARVAVIRGHKVVLCEKNGSLGGQFALGCIPPGKQEIAQGIKYFITQMKKLGVEVRLNTEVTPELLKELQPDTVVIATGSTPIIPGIPGVEQPNVLSAHDVLQFKNMAGRNVLIIGGGLVGCETADLLLEYGRKVTIIEMLDEIGKDIGSNQKAMMMDRFFHKQVTLFNQTMVKQILNNGVVIDSPEGVKELKGFDTIIIAVGTKPNTELVGSIEGLAKEVYVVGDANKPGKAIDAIYEGSAIARKI